MKKTLKGNNAPAMKFQSGAVVATIWENTTKDKDGESYTYHNVQLDRRYKDKDGEWQSTNQFRANDLPRVELVVRKAYELLALKDEE